MRLIWSLIAGVAVVATAFCAEYPPWGRYWEFQCFIFAIAGLLSGLGVTWLISRFYPQSFMPNVKSGAFFTLLLLTVFFSIVVAGMLSTVSPARNPFTAPNDPLVYLLYLAITVFCSWVWFLRGYGSVHAGLLLLLPALCASGMFLNEGEASTDYVFLMMLIVWAVSVWQEHGVPSLSHPLVGGGLVFIVVALIATVAGASVSNGLRILVRLFSGWVMVGGLVSARSVKENHNKILIVTLISGLLILLLVLYRYVTIIPIMGLQYAVAQRLWLAKADPNGLGLFLFLPLASLLALAGSFQRIYKLVFWVLVITFISVLFLTLSKAVLIGLGVMLITGALLSSRKRHRNVIIILIILVLFVAAAFLVIPIRDRLFSEHSLASRQMIWQAAWLTIAEHPVLGVGPNNSFIHATFAYQLPYELVYPDRVYLAGHSHNMWFILMEGVGLVGLIVFVWFCFITLRRTDKTCKWEVAALAGFFLASCFLGGLAAAVFVPFELWFLLALCSNPSVRRQNWSYVLVGIVIFLAMVGFGSKFLLRHSQKLIQEGELKRAELNLALAGTLNPFDIEVLDRQARIKLVFNDIVSAAQIYQRCTSLAPGNPVWNGKLGMTQLLLGDMDSALLEMAIAAKHDYFGVLGLGDFHAPNAAVLLLNGQTTEAFEEMKLSLSHSNTFPTGSFAALVEMPWGGWKTTICPDFMPQGSINERHLRTRQWLLGPDYVSMSAFRHVYPQAHSLPGCSDIVSKELLDKAKVERHGVYLASYQAYTLGNSLLQSRMQEGGLGEDLKLVYGGFHRIPITLLRQFINNDSKTNARLDEEIMPCISLGIYAYLSNEPSTGKEFLDNALSVVEPLVVAPGLSEKATIGFDAFPTDTQEILLYATSAADIKHESRKAQEMAKRYIQLCAFENTGWSEIDSFAELISYWDEGEVANLLSGCELQMSNNPYIKTLKAVVEYKRSDTTKSNPKAEEAIKLFPTHRNVLMTLGLTAAKHGDFLFSNKVIASLDELPVIESANLSELALVLWQNGRRNQAEELVEKLQKDYPNSPDGFLVASEIARDKNDKNSAERLLHDALQKQPTSSNICCVLAEEYINKHDYYRAGEYIDKALTYTPYNPAVWMVQARLEKELGKKLHSLSSFEKAYSLTPQSDWVQLSYAVALMENQNDEKALFLMQELINRNPANDDARYWMANTLRYTGRKEQAQEQYDILLKARNPKLASFMEASQNLVDLDRKGEAIALVKRMIEYYPNDAAAWASFSKINYHCNRIIDAKNALAQASKLEPGNQLYKHIESGFAITPVEGFIKDATDKASQGEFDAAQRVMEEAVIIYPDNAWVWATLGSIAKEAKNMVVAKNAIDRSVQLEPTNSYFVKLQLDLNRRELKAYIANAEKLSNSGNGLSALALMIEATAIYPDQAWSWATLGLMLERLNQDKAAKAVLSHAVELEPQNTAYQKLLVAMDTRTIKDYVQEAEQLLQQEKLSEARAIMEKAVYEFPQEAWGWATLGDIARRQEDFANARAALNKAVALEPGNPSWRKLLALLPR